MWPWKSPNDIEEKLGYETMKAPNNTEEELG